METEIRINAKEIIARLAKLQGDMNYLREHIEDTTITKDDIKSLEIAEKEFENNETTSLEDLKKELGM